MILDKNEINFPINKRIGTPRQERIPHSRGDFTVYLSVVIFSCIIEQPPFG